MAASNISRDAVSAADLAPVDEFHIGGRIATQELVRRLALMATDKVLDIGCGIGGPARFIAETFQCEVTGIDLTPEYVDTARTLSDWVGLSSRTSFTQGNAIQMHHGDSSFDAAYMLHVGMNIEAKQSLFREVNRVLRPGGKLGVYDVMRIGPGDEVYPVPWATTPDTSFVVSPEAYKSELLATGWELIEERNRREFARGFFVNFGPNRQSRAAHRRWAFTLLWVQTPVKKSGI